MLTDWVQRWRNGLQLWRPRHAGGFDPDRYDVREIKHADALGFVMAHHYLASWPSVSLRYGLFDLAAGGNGELVGVLTLGVPMSVHALPVLFPKLKPNKHSLEWSRLILLDEVPANAESWFATRALRHAAVEHGVLGVVTYADPMEHWRRGPDGVWVQVTGGHIGGVYQAMSMTYTGCSRARWRWTLPDGSELTDRAIEKVKKEHDGAQGVMDRLVAFGAVPLGDAEAPAEWLVPALHSIGARQQRHPGNHRYATFTGTPTQRRRFGEMGRSSLPYPRVQLQLDVGALEAVTA